ncbi:hypothetical protein BJV85_001290 [Clostridium acetobutylicum]|uniref:Predicted membrane protein n=1 Tax=Clostridium acetobutylicum (strain ATCC 824 / DSM 792 / JCM 1419 / IAM 19013 / LMG 5710 / NBRC 13948 / NRRL B-527 / VKM B-1787 / 2291 / W) TaxID=272562 RepID=Q97FX5_CLOAB|nr:MULTISPECIES: hypothetical protein [Clostridium]AAK80548.1 Predicted membrane protein [Clostridium acetobutylicum ATCC 824]ADZ21647.1 membrane protein [Clostridium acetobutylicum EA 2018]AEI32459.1 hypothetical protein SMB_G2635 [Clostridium acetobutylicum DSM 1731]AWV79035.1 hypothetical protein DK921_02750 [Clostridium acetobutylicum]MBC2395005.1 hypothetical protein [Clostridium acetobutylicum]
MNGLKNGKSYARRTVAYLSVLGTTQLHLRNPFVIAAWSVAFPGMGHLLLSKYLRGFLLFGWELLINYKSHINLLIFYSFIGDFNKVKQIADIRWVFFYIPTYIFSIWDSYRTTIDINHSYILAAREAKDIKSFKIDTLEINYLDKRNPWVSVVWSILTPGSGQLYIHRLITAVFVVSAWIFVCYESKFMVSVYYTLLGNFGKAKMVLNIQWFLNIPSIYFFSIYDAYVNTVENNKLYDWEQAKFLESEYQDPNFVMPLKDNIRGDKMYVISTFEHSVYLELAITAIEMKGIKKERIMSIPMDKKGEERMLFDSIQSSDGLSLFDLPSILAVIGGIFGSIYGFVLKWGPILWGLIGIVSCSCVGFVIKLIVTRKYRDEQKCSERSEVVLIIECDDSKVEMVKDILWKNNALGVRKLDYK